jgi:hypothetical protein
VENSNIISHPSNRKSLRLLISRSFTIGLALCFLGPPGVAIAKNSSDASDTAGAKFPARVGLFVRHGSVKLDEGGDPWVTYWAGALVLINMFYYRTHGHTLEREYADCRDSVKMVTADARLVSDTRATISPGGRARTGWRAVFTSNKLGISERAKSQLLIFQLGDRFVKYRITYPLAHAERAEKEIDNFLRSFPWPRN